MEDTPHAVIVFNSQEEILRYQRAAFVISTTIPDTQAVIVSVKDKLPGEPIPPPGSTDIGGPWDLLGVVHGPAGLQNESRLEWSAQVLEILEAHGLHETNDVIN